MKQYKITKIVFAKDLLTALKNENKAELVECVLNEIITVPNCQMGFK